MVNKGRQPVLDHEKLKSTSLKGSKNPQSKLIEEDVLEIRELFEQGFKQTFLVLLYNTTKSTVNNVVLRRTWKHV